MLPKHKYNSMLLLNCSYEHFHANWMILIMKAYLELHCMKMYLKFSLIRLSVTCFISEILKNSNHSWLHHLKLKLILDVLYCFGLEDQWYFATKIVLTYCEKKVSYRVFRPDLTYFEDLRGQLKTNFCSKWRYLCIPEVWAIEFHQPVLKNVT
jgi:hypothetical protein